jgi:cell division septum initiation protein DivIVA
MKAPKSKAPPMEEPLDALPRTDVDLETELESLREFVIRSGPVMMNHRLFVDVDEFEGRLDQIISILPKDIRRAKRIVKEEQRLLQDAKDEARRLLDEARAEAEQILTAAREEADRLVEASAIRQRALEQSEATLAHAEETARQIREKSYDYAQQVIGNVVGSLHRLTQSVEQDREQLEQNRPDAQ